MTSLRNSGSQGSPRTSNRARSPLADDHLATPAPAEGSRRDAYLDAARDCILDLGWRRTTLTEVARRAGVSRMTIYRTWGDMSSMLGDLMTREWAGVARSSLPPGHLPASLDRMVDTFVDLVGSLRENELFVRILELDPELLLPYLLTRTGRAQQGLISLAEQAIEYGQAQGWVRPGNPVHLARTLVLAGHGFVLSAQTMVDDRMSPAEVQAELAELVRRTLAA